MVLGLEEFRLSLCPADRVQMGSTSLNPVSHPLPTPSPTDTQDSTQGGWLQLVPGAGGGGTVYFKFE